MRLTVIEKIDYAHRLFNYDGECHNIHGHTAKVEINISGAVDDKSGMVIDFKALKSLIRDRLKKYDHALVLNKEDPLIQKLSGAAKIIVIGGHVREGVEPTAENFSGEIYRDLVKIISGFTLYQYMRVVSVTFFETENCGATYTEVDGEWDA